MIRQARAWLERKWQRQDPERLQQCYRAVFTTLEGQEILQHWMDSVYCTVYEGNDPQQLWAHNARRAFVQEILENIDMAETPEKYRAGKEA